MANTENHDQSTLPAKRKCDLTVSEVKEESSVKAVKKSEDVMEKVDERREIGNVLGDDCLEEDDESDVDYEAEDAGRKKKKKEDVVDSKGKGIMRDDKGKGKVVVGGDNDNSDDGSDDDDVDDDNDKDDDSDDDINDTDDSDEFWLGDDDDSDLENPLGEVDLDNILPSRTRNKGGGVRKGIVIADDLRDGRRNGDGSNSNA